MRASILILCILAPVVLLGGCASRYHIVRIGRRHGRPERAAVALCACTLAPVCIAADDALTLYVGRISSANAWHDIVTEPSEAEFVDAYMAVAALSHVLTRYRHDDVSVEVEGQIGYNFGDQSHWEFNLAAGPRWRRFPWSDTVATSAAFGLGLSITSERPEVEVELEGDTKRLLIYWIAELTLGPPESAWAASIRLHHRSGAFGLLGDDGGMNSIALGIRYAF